MRGKTLLTYAVGVNLLLGAATVHAQGGASGALASESSAGRVQTAKEIRAENRKLGKAVLRSLSKTKGLNVDRIVVVAKGGSVSLEGYVPELSQVDLATSVARDVPGVVDVRNLLIVRAEGR
ncbi:BON domain-containing protein [Paraburkholderia sp. LEh10]|uniref:BON domain-containing protein n=1 Tax=Paraburkholderia sp. LEh10 TaxID=2821353 RepID=UPI001AE6D506|nr:BON domain-containing protein [Paraburkholderia sp. LEh10]MBP0593296.1 BON domain-containing protein [Paraburkholderia sp. LEh10]